MRPAFNGSSYGIFARPVLWYHFEIRRGCSASLRVVLSISEDSEIVPYLLNNFHNQCLLFANKILMNKILNILTCFYCFIYLYFSSSLFFSIDTKLFIKNYLDGVKKKGIKNMKPNMARVVPSE